MDKEEEKTSIKTHEDLVIYQKAFNLAIIIFEFNCTCVSFIHQEGDRFLG